MRQFCAGLLHDLFVGHPRNGAADAPPASIGALSEARAAPEIAVVDVGQGARGGRDALRPVAGEAEVLALRRRGLGAALPPRRRR